MCIKVLYSSAGNFAGLSNNLDVDILTLPAKQPIR
jgi:hypothetical protein